MDNHNMLFLNSNLEGTLATSTAIPRVPSRILMLEIGDIYA